MEEEYGDFVHQGFLFENRCGKIKKGMKKCARKGRETLMNGMNGNDWERFGNDILRTVQDAIESCNYDRLNQTIANTVNQVVDGVARGARSVNESAARRKANAYNYNYNYGEMKQPPVVIEVNKPSNVGGILSIVFGGIAAIIAMILLIVFGVQLLITHFAGFAIGLGGAGILALTGGFLIVSGIKGISQNIRFKQYLKVIGNREYCNIRELAVKVRKEDAYVVKDLEKMIKKKWFGQGHLDKNKTCLMVTDKMFMQYQQLEEQKSKAAQEEQMQKEAQQKVRENQEAYRKSLSPEVQKVIAEGDAYVEKLRECNDAIPGKEISKKISHMEMIVDKIFDRVEENPASVGEIRKLMDYYLPTTVKLLEAYIQMDAQPISGDNIASSKREIEATLDTLNVAFEKLLDSMFQAKAWDVSSDISVLNTMLAQEGLKEDGLKR